MDNLRCNSYDVDTLMAAAQDTVSHVKVVEQEASLLSTSKAARERITAWRSENAGCLWDVKLDV